MKTKHKILIGVAVVMAILFGVDKCGQSKKLQRVEGEKIVLEKMLDSRQKESAMVIMEKENIITQRDERITELESTVAEKNRELATKDVEIVEIEEAYDETAPPEEQIANLKKQVELWKGKFAIAEQIIAEKDKIIFSLIEKYNAQVVISDEYKGLYEATLELNETLDFQIKLLKRKAIRLKLGGQVKSTIILGAIGYVVWNLVGK